jgi:tRNA-splicing ligase RtcB
MTGDDLIRLGFKPGKTLGLALKLANSTGDQAESDLSKVLADPAAYRDDPRYGELAGALEQDAKPSVPALKSPPAPYRIWGTGIEPQAVDQMKAAASLPVAVSGALMPDAHVGYGLPIGGVLATGNAVIPYAVGVDIACRMKLSIFDLPVKKLQSEGDRLAKTLERETSFGTGAVLQKPAQHAVLDEDWSITAITKKMFDKARGQLGTSGSGNHFVEFGVIKLDCGELGLDAGEYLSLLSHSGSRGTGAQIANYYSRLAMDLHPELPPELRRLAWLDLDTQAGQEYWAAMNLMGLYAAANHAVIHDKIARALGASVIAGVENHHNFAWKEHHGGRDVIVHRKGATPAGAGVLGVIPGSMASPGFVVRGRGNADSLNSASHGAGRAMSRTAAKEKYRWSHVQPQLEAAGVRLLSAGIDEAPVAYKDIHQVMAAQADLVEVIARFDPKIVKMAEAGERPED